MTSTKQHQSLSGSQGVVPSDKIPSSSSGPLALLPEDDPTRSYHIEYLKKQLGADEVEKRIQPLSDSTVGILWMDVRGPPAAKRLGDILDSHPSVKWVQLSQAGINTVTPLFEKHGDKLWTSAKGSFGQPVAEHALTLTLALLRNLPRRIRATQWEKASGLSLFGKHVTLIGAGGISLALIHLVAPFHVTLTVLRRKAEALDNETLPAAYADGKNIEVLSFKEMNRVLPKTDVLVVAAAATPDTQGIVGQEALELLPKSAVVINVARGELVQTDAIAAALRKGTIAGAALDVTDPEPLPESHPLWSLTLDKDAHVETELPSDERGNLIITPHTANTPAMNRSLLAERYEKNIKAWIEGKGKFEGVVDTENGY